MAKKALKRFKNISLGLLAGLVFLLLLAGGLLNAPFVHRYVANKAAAWATEYMNCKVDMGRVELVLLKRSLKIHDLVVYDCQDNPTVYAGEAWAVLHDFDFKNLTLQYARLTDPCIRITRYEGDSISDFKRVLKKISSRPKKDSALRKPFQMLAFEIENATFYYNDFNRPKKDNGTVDFKHIRLTEGYAKGRNFYTRIGVVRADIDHLRAKEASGVEIDDFSTHIELDKGELHFTSAHIKTSGSDLDLDLSLEAGVPDWKPYADFVHRVRFDAEVRPSVLRLPDLRHFVAAVGDMQGSVNLSSQVKGPVSDLNLHNLKFAFGKHTALHADLHLQGIPDTLNLNLNVYRLHAEKQDLEHIVFPSGESLKLPEILREWEDLTLNGTLDGNLDKFISEFDMESNLGNIHIRNSVVDTLGGPAVMVGHLDASAVRLDKLFGKDSLLGTTDLGVDFYLVGKTLEALRCEVDGMVSNLQIAGKTLQPINLDLHLQKNFFGGRVECRDSNLDFRLSGNLDFRAGDSRSHCELDLRNVDLTPLHLFGDTGDFRVTTFLRVAYTGRQFDSIEGYIRLMNTKIQRLGASYAMPEMRVALVKEGRHRWAYVRSELLDFDLHGFWSFATFENQIKHVLALQIPSLFDAVPQATHADATHPMHYTVHLKLKEADNLLQLIFPDVRVPVGLSGELNYDGDEERLALSLDLPYLQYHRFAYMNGGLQADFSAGRSSVRTQAESLYLDDSIRLPNFSLSLTGAEKDVLDYALMWDGSQKSGLYGNFHFYPGRRVRFEIEESGVFLGGSLWRNYKGSYLFFAPDSIVFGQFGFRSSDARSGVVFNGELSHTPASHLRVDFDEFSLDYLHYFLRKIHMDMEGSINGYAQVNDFYDMFSFEADLNIDNLLINRHSYGRLDVDSRFNRKDAIKLGVHLKENRQGKPFETLSLDGTFYRTQGKKLDFAGKVNEFPVQFLSGFLASVASDLEGTLNGDLKMGGTLSSPLLFAEVKTNNLAATIPFLGTRYTFTDMALKLTSDKISFERGRFTDEEFHSSGTLKGAISHHNFKNMRLDMGLDFQKLLAVHTKRSPDVPFWGKVLASGALRIDGPINDLSVTLSAVVDNPSDIHFDFSSMSVNNGANFIQFMSETPELEDSTKISFEKFYARTRTLARKRRNHLSMDLNLGINPGLAVSVGLGNTAMDGTLSATGSGILRLSSKNGTTRLFGTYTINGGEFDISMVDIIKKKFELEEGGTISWVGPIDDARINVRADYQTRASLYPILSQFGTATDEERHVQKSDVKSIIILTGNLMNPDISFDIDLMNTDEDSKDKFFAVVKKDDEDEMLRQTFSLLMFNSFMALDNSSAGIGNAALSSSSDILFSQFNNFLSQFTENFNIGLNYSPNVGGANSGTGNSEFQVMMSGQLFNDRLLINGNLGVSENGSSAVSAGRSATNVVGEVDVEWKFTEELRLKAFNHSNEQDLTKPANSYTQGVGVVFKRDFDNWKEFIYGAKGKRTKEQRQEERAQKREERETKKELQQEGREARRNR